MVSESPEQTTWVPTRGYRSGRSYYWTSIATDALGATGPVSTTSVFETIDVGGGGGGGCTVGKAKPGVTDAPVGVGMFVAMIGMLVISRRKRSAKS